MTPLISHPDQLIQILDPLPEPRLPLPQGRAHGLSTLQDPLPDPKIQEADLVAALTTRQLTIGSGAKERQRVVEALPPSIFEAPVLVLARVVAVPVAAVGAERLAALAVFLRLGMLDPGVDLVGGQGERGRWGDGTVLGLLFETPLAAIHPIL